MSRYLLVDEDGNTYPITNGSFKLIDDDATTDLDIIEKSYRAGAVLPGIQRDASKELIFQIDINEPTDILYRDKINTLYYQARKAIKIRDSILSIETDVRIIGKSAIFDEGGYLRGSVITLTFQQILPYWEDINYIIEPETTGDIVIDNTGYVDTPPIITVQANGIVNKFLIQIAETGVGIGVADLAFGSVNADTYIIDNVDGEILLEGILRNQKIIEGTGFFNLRVGINTIQTTATSGSVSVTIKYKRRYYF